MGTALGGLLVGSSVLLSSTELADKAHGLAAETTRQPSAGTGVEESAKLIGTELEEVVKFNTTVRELYSDRYMSVTRRV